jgi:hypothetical protein
MAKPKVTDPRKKMWTIVFISIKTSEKTDNLKGKFVEIFLVKV